MSEDPELAQARAFVRELTQHAQTLVRRHGTLPLPAASRPDAELAIIRRQIEQLHRRFPALRNAPTPSVR
ncbi:hypothetical protein ACIRRA_43575 [Nocardia sp. NPDC101769]|uniref:hypothetical protein n=1 Tax=Nocardia sp. NPDC101769 TaxID=3364333 RepID=UPI0037FCFAC1